MAVASGSGIMPFPALLQAALAADAGIGTGARCMLSYGDRIAASTIFNDMFNGLKNRHLARLALNNVWSRELVDTPSRAGRIDGEKIATMLRLLRLLRLSGAVDAAFAFGPHAMNVAVDAALLAGGVPSERIHIERFDLPPVVARAGVEQPGLACRTGSCTAPATSRSAPKSWPPASC